MTFALRPTEHAVIVAALKFANMRKLKSALGVESLFKGINNVFVVRRIYAHAYLEDQLRLRDWLQRIVGGKGIPRDRVSVGNEIAQQLRKEVPARIMFVDGKLEYRIAINNVGASCAWAVALLLDERLGLANRLQQCGWSKCGRFVFDFEPRGRPRRFCFNTDHKVRHDAETGAERQRRSREKRRE